MIRSPVYYVSADEFDKEFCTRNGLPIHDIAGWYFEDRTDTPRGPYTSEQRAFEAFDQYCIEVLRDEDSPGQRLK